jgi:hypothetical protein
MVCTSSSGNTTALGHVRVAIPYSLAGSALRALREGFGGRENSANQQRSSRAQLLRLSSPECRTAIVEDGNDSSMSKPDLWIATNTRWSSVGVDGAGGEP